MTELATVPSSGKPFLHLPAPPHPVLEPPEVLQLGNVGMQGCLDSGCWVQDAGYLLTLESLGCVPQDS